MSGPQVSGPVPSGPEVSGPDKAQSSFARPEGWSAPGAALVRSAATDSVPSLGSLGRVHIVGIAGAGMSGLARILLARGLDVSGCEARTSDTVEALRAQGAKISIGHAVSHLDDVDTVLYSTAIPPTHLELAEARRRELPVLRRAAGLAAGLEGKRTLAVAGTHGKTTTTSLLTVALQTCGMDPSFAIGGNLYETGRNAHYGSGDWAVVEADESDGSFLLTRPDIAIITNVEADHLENHGDLAGIHRAFEQFIDRMGPAGESSGILVACLDDPGSARSAEYARRHGVQVVTYGEGAGADVRLTSVVEAPSSVTFTLACPGKTGQPDTRLTGTGLPILTSALDGRTVTVGALVGRHMALNATAALVAAATLGLDLDRVAAVWHDFQGVKRRFELRGSVAGVRVYDDYAHHPTEVAAALHGARHAAGGGRLIAVFQPGTYSRTQTFAVEFARALGIADIAVVMDVFPSRELPIPGVTGALVADAVDKEPDAVIYEPRWTAVPSRLAAVARSGDVIVTMGIGDVYLLCPEILAEIGARAAGSPSTPAGPVQSVDGGATVDGGRP